MYACYKHNVASYLKYFKHWERNSIKSFILFYFILCNAKNMTKKSLCARFFQQDFSQFYIHNNGMLLLNREKKNLERVYNRIEFVQFTSLI